MGPAGTRGTEVGVCVSVWWCWGGFALRSAPGACVGAEKGPRRRWDVKALTFGGVFWGGDTSRRYGGATGPPLPQRAGGARRACGVSRAKAAASVPLRCGAEVFRMCCRQRLCFEVCPGEDEETPGWEVSGWWGGGWEFSSGWAMEVRAVSGLSWEGEECRWVCVDLFWWKCIGFHLSVGCNVGDFVFSCSGVMRMQNRSELCCLLPKPYFLIPAQERVFCAELFCFRSPPPPPFPSVSVDEVKI